MYKPNVLGSTTAGAGAAILPNTGDNSVLFIAAGALLVVGLVAMVASGILAHKASKSEANA